MLCSKYKLQSERTIETPCSSTNVFLSFFFFIWKCWYNQSKTFGKQCYIYGKCDVFFRINPRQRVSSSHFLIRGWCSKRHHHRYHHPLIIIINVIIVVIIIIIIIFNVIIVVIIILIVVIILIILLSTSPSSSSLSSSSAVTPTSPKRCLIYESESIRLTNAPS